jgi:hypothetical protein
VKQHFPVLLASPAFFYADRFHLSFGCCTAGDYPVSLLANFIDFIMETINFLIHYSDLSDFRI